jgi:CRISPR-associated endonuclease/helicase Cas3
MRHDSMGFFAWREHLKPTDKDATKVLEVLVEATTGHHGQPPNPYDKIGRSLYSLYSETNLDDLSRFHAECSDLFQFEIPILSKEQFESLRVTSWWIAGIGILCDWLGSNQRFFPYQDQIMPLDEYFQVHALPHAKKAIAEVNLSPVTASPLHRISSLFPYIDVPTPLQEAIKHLPLANGPQLVIAEDVTGAGKTEAAAYLAHRMLAAGKGSGLFISLPTMATANAMYRRMSGAYRKLFDGEASLVLAHGKASRIPNFIETIVPRDAAESDYQPGDHTASAVCNWWFADNKKASLFAHAGIGTIDQALMSILRSRHQALRLAGLRRKILIVDEVHACDDYMNKLLMQLLLFHAEAGGSAILLSATLPHRTRQKLLSIYDDTAVASNHS